MLTDVTYHLISIYRRNEHIKSSNNHLKICNIWTNCKLFFVTNIGFQQCNAPGFKSWTGKKITTKKCTLVQIHIRQLFLNMNEKKLNGEKILNRFNEHYITYIWQHIILIFTRTVFQKEKKNVICDCSCNNTVVLAASRIYTDVKETVALVTMTTVDIGLRPRLIASTCLVQLCGVCTWQHVWK